MVHDQGTFNFEKHSATKAEAFGGVDAWTACQLMGCIAAPTLEDLHLDGSRGPTYGDPLEIHWNDWVLESVYNMLKLFAITQVKFVAKCVGLAVVWRGWERSAVSKTGVYCVAWGL
jgi:hypothetical protein